VDAGGGVTVRGWAPARSSAVVFTKTMTSSPRHGTSLATGDLAEEVAVLKRAPGKDLAVYGGSSFVSALIEWGLLDEYHLFVNPVALGRGDPISRARRRSDSWSSSAPSPFPSGIVLLTYRPR
jgi:dihydrofolate reductase